MAGSVSRRGYACIIVNIKPINREPARAGNQNSFVERRGAQEDYSNLQLAIGENGVGFELINPTTQWSCNLTIDKWDHERGEREAKENKKECCLKCHIKSLDHSQSECFLLAISSHGNEEEELEILLSDGEKLFMSEIFDTLDDRWCPTLSGKPRILVLQACRSSWKADPEMKIDRGIETKELIPSSQETPAPPKTSEHPNMPLRIQRTAEQSGSFKLPTDFAVLYATVRGKTALRNEKLGSWMITEFKDVVVDEREKAAERPDNTMNLFHIVTRVTRGVACKETTVYLRNLKENVRRGDDGNPIRDPDRSGHKNTVCFQHTLTTPVLFKFQCEK